ncbi:MAG: hypothetical protein IKW99_05110 [Bacteroidales bacterium]|nr:hypothetical protein [Bacteroidales bacterium]
MSKRGKHLALKIILWSILGLAVALAVAVQVVLSPKVLTRLANKYAAEYVDGEVRFSNIKASVFKSFPNLNVTADGFSVVGQDPPDTLASFDRLSLSVNYMEALRGKVKVRHAILEHPRIFLHQYDSTRASWDIIKIPSSEDTSSFALPPISVGKVSLEKSPFVEYKNYPDSIAAAVSVDHLTINNLRDHYGIDLDSRISLDMVSTGKMDLPVKIQSEVFPDFDRKVFSVKDLKASLAMLDLQADGMVDMSADSIYIKASAAMDDEPVKDVTKYFGENFPILKKLDTDARLSLDADCDGFYNPKTGKLPELTVHAFVPDSKIAWKGLDEKGRFDLDATAYIRDGILSAEVPDLCLKIKGADVELKGSSEDLLNGDPLLKVDSRLHLVLDSLMRFLPEGTDIRARGNLNGYLKGSFRLSQLDLYNFDKIGLQGSLTSPGIRIRAFGDSLSAFLGRTAVSLGPLSKTSPSDSSSKHVGLTASVDSLSAQYGPSTYFRGRGIRLTARNSEETVKGTKNRHPLTGRIDITSIGMMDLDSCFVGVRESMNTYKLYQAPKDGENTPYLNISSQNKRIFVRESVNRYSMEDAALAVTASPVKSSRQNRGPGFAEGRRPRRDSLGQRRPIRPAHERDFDKKDIRISLGESFSKFIREWNISGNLSVGNGKVITPYMPLENSLAGLEGKFTNNQIDLSSLTLRSGSSDISARGTLSGLRRALSSGRGMLNLDLRLSSDTIDVDELLLAINAGRQFTPPEGNAALSGVDDNEYMEVVKEEAAADSVSLSSLIVVPGNLNAKVNVQAGTIRYSDLETSFASADLEMKDRCLQVSNTLAMTNMGEVFMEGFYATRSKQDITTGFDLMFSNITAEKVIQLFPAVDSIVPMLKAFSGMLDCELAATASIDTAMNIMLPTLNGMVKIDGKDLTLSESEGLDKLRKTLRFKDRDSSYIDKMSVRGIVKENQLEVFPFILKVDRYTLALDGLQGFDQNFKYHVAALKSPIPFRFGVNLGGNFADWRWKLGKAKFKSTKIPLFDDEIDGLRLNLVSSIHNIFDRGIEHAIRRNEEAQQAIEEKKAEVAYSSDLTEDLSEKEVKELEAVEEKDSSPRSE